MPLESNPLLIRQHDERVFGPFQVLDEKGVPHNLSVAPVTFRFRAYDRPGGTKMFETGSNGGQASGGKMLLSTGKAFGHYYWSAASQAISTNAPGLYPTEVEITSGNVVRTFDGPILHVIERLK